MRMTVKLLSLFTAGLLVTACEMEQRPTPSDVGSTYTMPSAALEKGKKGVYKVLENGRKGIDFDSTDLDIISEERWGCCRDDLSPKEAAIVKTNRELEIRLGDYTPNVSIEEIDLASSVNNPGLLEVTFYLKVVHSAGSNANLPFVEVPLFFTCTDIPSQKVFKKGSALVRVDMNKPFELQKVRAFFDVNDLRARGLRGWSLLTGIMKSEMNRKFEAEVAKEKEQKIAEAGGRYEIDTTTTNASLAETPRAVDYAAPNLVRR